MYGDDVLIIFCSLLIFKISGKKVICKTNEDFLSIRCFYNYLYLSICSQTNNKMTVNYFQNNTVFFENKKQYNY